MKFRGRKSISSAAVETDRSGNERVVKYSKASGLLAHGMSPKSDLKNLMMFG